MGSLNRDLYSAIAEMLPTNKTNGTKTTSGEGNFGVCVEKN